MNQSIPTTENPGWGFHSTIAHHANPAVAWQLAMVAIADATGCADYEVRAFLDSRHGRHFADDVANQLVDGKAIADAISDAAARWMGWRITAQIARETDIPRGLPYLTGFVINEGIAALASD